jgi:putative ABC transport system permease protein
MLAITLADLRFRLRQFLIAVAGAGVVFAMAILLTGMSQGFYNEIERTVRSVPTDVWIVPEGASGPFTSVQSFPAERVAEVEALPGVTEAGGVAISLQTVDRGGDDPLERVMMIGADLEALVQPDEGEPVGGPGDAVVDRRLHLEIGDSFELAGKPFTVVGLVEGLTMLGGSPDVFLSLEAAQEVLFGGAPLATAIWVDGVPGDLPAGLTAMSLDEVEDESLGPMKDAVVSVDNSRYMMWVVAAIIIAALVYVSSLQRTRDFAVLKAMGASSGLLYFGVAIQAVLVALGAAGFALATAWLFRPIYTVPLEVPWTAYVVLPLVAVAVGLVSSLVALRRALTVDPSLAFGAG